MIVYPQLTQFPVEKRRLPRTVVNRMPDGSSVRLADPAGETTEWTLRYTELSDEELGVLERFFEAAEGTLNLFTFLDPTANLLAWSEDLSNETWQTDPMLTAVKTASGWQLTNGSGGTQAITQTISGPGDYLYCLSAYVRADRPVELNLRVGSSRKVGQATTDWRRLVYAANGDPGSKSVLFGVEVAAGGTLQVRSIQAESQAGASEYKTSTRGGVYEEARLGEDSLTVTSTAPNRHSCAVKIIHANHI
jgi:hypothetical protein